MNFSSDLSEEGASLPSDSLRAIFEARAEQQYPRPRKLPDPRLDRKFARTCELVRSVLPCEAFLDAGCGDGRYLVALAAELPERVAAIDIAERVLETARAAIAPAALNADLRRANLECLPFECEEFDLILCAQVIEHVRDRAAALAELARVLRPGGTLVLTTDNQHNIASRLLNLPRAIVVRTFGLRGARGRIHSPANALQRQELKQHLEAVGLSITSFETFRFHLMWPLNLRPLQLVINRIEEALPPHNIGDVLAATAIRPATAGPDQCNVLSHAAAKQQVRGYASTNAER